MRVISSELIRSDRSLKKFEKSQVGAGEKPKSPFLNFLKRNKIVVEMMDSSLSELEVCAFLQAKWESMSSAEQLEFNVVLSVENPESEQEPDAVQILDKKGEKVFLLAKKVQERLSGQEENKNIRRRLKKQNSKT